MTLLLKNLLFILLIPGSVAVYLPRFIAAQTGARAGAFPVLAAALLTLGLGIVLLCIWDFARQGRATPAPVDPPKFLVVGRLYQFSRNPMYIGVLTVIAGWALWYGSAWILAYGAAAGFGFHLFVILVEEPALSRRFGEAYKTYCSRTPRWLPRLWPSKF